MSELNGDTKECPFCAETIKTKAIKCKHCGSMLNEKELMSIPKSSPPQQLSLSKSPGIEEKKEKIFLQEGNVLVSNSRVVINEKTYSLGNITSVEMEIVDLSAGIKPFGGCTLFFAVMGIIMGWGTLSSPSGCGIILLITGLVFCIFGIIALASPSKFNYSIKLRSASTETQALISENKEYIQEIIKAINDAMKYR